MTLLLLILSLFLKSSSCQLQCSKEILDDKEFSISMTDHTTAESGDCIWIPFNLTFPKNKVTPPYKKIWFKEDPQTNVDIQVVDNMKLESKNTFRINGLPRGEYEYGFKLEWGCNQTYIFPKRLRIYVSELTRKPIVRAYPMKEGQAATLTCRAYRLCSGRSKVHWKWTKADGQSTVQHDYDYDFHFHFQRGREISRFHLTPKADDHNTNITCVAEYNYSIVTERTVTLTVEFPPQILNGSQCVVEGKLLVCVCISRGNPLPPITWPFASLTEYSVISSSSIQTVNSTFTMPAADYLNSTVKCISSNGLGQAEIVIPIQNYTEKYGLDGSQRFDANLPWITAVSFSLNLILLTSLIICAYKRYKNMQKVPCDREENNTYASLKKADVQEEYTTISPKPK
ncbi:sialic acid-binding Ig-like lectin 5 [Scomber scombrus]